VLIVIFLFCFKESLERSDVLESNVLTTDSNTQVTQDSMLGPNLCVDNNATVDTSNAQHPASNVSDSLDESGELMIAEEEENNQNCDDKEEPEKTPNSEALLSQSVSPVASVPEGSHEIVTSSNAIFGIQNLRSNDEGEQIARESVITFEADLENLRNQVHEIQQQNTVHLQMIHYLVTQMNYLRSQRNYINGNSPPPNGMQFNPLIHLMSSYGGANFSNQAQSGVASLAATYGAMNGFAAPNLHGPRKPFVIDSVKTEMSVENKMQDRQSVRPPMSSIIGLDKRFDGKSQVPTPPSNMPNSASKNELLYSSNSTPSTSSGQRSSPPDLQLEKPLKNQCLTCGKVLSCGSALKLHYRTHTGNDHLLILFTTIF